MSNIQAITDLRQTMIKSPGCEEYDDGNVKQWLIIEIATFGINILVIAIKLIVTRLNLKSIKKTVLKQQVKYLTNVWKKLKDQKAIDEITIELEEADRFWGLSKKSKLLNIKSKVKVIDKFEDYDKLKE